MHLAKNSLVDVIYRLLTLKTNVKSMEPLNYRVGVNIQTRLYHTRYAKALKP